MWPIRNEKKVVGGVPAIVNKNSVKLEVIDELAPMLSKLVRSLVREEVQNANNHYSNDHRYDDVLDELSSVHNDYALLTEKFNKQEKAFLSLMNQFTRMSAVVSKSSENTKLLVKQNEIGAERKLSASAVKKYDKLTEEEIRISINVAINHTAYINGKTRKQVWTDFHQQLTNLTGYSAYRSRTKAPSLIRKTIKDCYGQEGLVIAKAMSDGSL